MVMSDNHQERLNALSAAMLPLDRDGRIIGNSPHLHVLRSARASTCRTHATLPNLLHDDLIQLCNAPRGRPRQWAEDYAKYLEALSSFAPLGSVRAGMVYGFPEMVDASDEAVSVTAENADLLTGGLDEWTADAQAGVPMMAVVEAGQAVALCASVQAVNGIHCAGVETVRHLRGRGFGARAVRAWANMVRARGAEPFYATTFDNLGSQAVARTMGLRPICSEFSAECQRDGAAHGFPIS